MNGSRLIGIWRNGPSNGRIEFAFDPRNQTFDGHWGYGTEALKYRQSGKRSPRAD